MSLESRAKHCITHHHGCNCREWKHQQELALAKELLVKVTWRSKIHPSDCICSDCEAVEAFLSTSQVPELMMVRRDDLQQIYERYRCDWDEDVENRLKVALEGKEEEK